MTTKCCAKQIPDAANPCVLEVNHSGGCIPALFWCHIHRRANVDPEFCSACMADATTKVSVTLQVLEEALQKRNAKLEERLDALGAEFSKVTQEFDDRTRRLRTHLNDITAWRLETKRKIAALETPLGETLRKIVAERVVLLAKRIYVDVPF